VEKLRRAGQAIENVAHAHCMLNTKGYKHSYVILISFSTAKWLCERASMLCYTYIACFKARYSCRCFWETGNPRIEVGMNLTQVPTDKAFFYVLIMVFTTESNEMTLLKHRNQETCVIVW